MRSIFSNRFLHPSCPRKSSKSLTSMASALIDAFLRVNQKRTLSQQIARNVEISALLNLSALKISHRVWELNQHAKIVSVGCPRCLRRGWSEREREKEKEGTEELLDYISMLMRPIHHTFDRRLEGWTRQEESSVSSRMVSWWQSEIHNID